MSTPYLVTMGETMALFSAQNTGPLAHAATMSLGIGGSESNVAIGVSRLGGAAVWCGRVGNDPLGRLVEREIRAEGVDTRAIIDNDARTGLMIKERRTQATQSITYYRAHSAGSRLSRNDIDTDLIGDAAILHLSGITAAVSPSAADAVAYAMTVARANGVTVSFDLNHRSNLWSDETATQAYERLLPLCDIVFAGVDEARVLTYAEDPPNDLAKSIAARGPAEVIIKLGGEGAVALIDGVSFQQIAVPITPVDTVGAGDAFVAGYLFERMRGNPPIDRLALAARTGAFVCLAAGDWEGLPRLDELELLDFAEPVKR